MAPPRAGRLIVCGLIAIALAAVAMELAKHSLLTPPQRSAYEALLGPFGFGSYIWAAGMLPFLLAGRSNARRGARRAVIGAFAIYAVCGALWWALAAEAVRYGAPARLAWFFLVPGAFVLLLHSEAVSRLVEDAT